MCGIAGFVTKNKQIDHMVLGEMIHGMSHRGPDDDGITMFKHPHWAAGFGHKRLSIIDLSENGKQPMQSRSGKYCITFNGAIYNYRELRKSLENSGFRFNSNTDTEVILYLFEKYHINCLQYLNGMFAFAIYNTEDSSLFIARDRLGIRPLYYYSDSRSFVFASEIKALHRYPNISNRVNYNSLYQYVKNRYVRNPETIFEGVQKLQPGHYMVVKQLKVEIHEYWNIHQFNKEHTDLKDSMQQLDEELQKSVKLRMVSDVPFGAFLSGGIDSSLIVALMSQHNGRSINTFSVGFKEAQYSELPYAKQIANRFNTNHHELFISCKDVTDHLYDTVYYRDAPVSEPSDIPLFLLAREAKKSVSVILSGEGSDELFAGYPKYSYDNLSRSFLYHLLFNNRLVSGCVHSLSYQHRKLKLAYSALCEKDDLKRYISWFSSFRHHQLNELFSNNFTSHHQDVLLNNHVLCGLTDMDKMLYLDIKYWLTDNLLERADKMLMSSAVEGRVPFLDHNIVEMAFKMDDSLKVHHFSRKYIVKKLAEKYIPKENIYRKKVGFYIPVGDWFRQDLKDMVCDHLLSARFRQRDIFNMDYVSQILNDHFHRVNNYEKEIWMLLNLEIWFRTFIDSTVSQVGSTAAHKNTISIAN